jgi:Domain of unknown function (DUF4112)
MLAQLASAAHLGGAGAIIMSYAQYSFGRTYTFGAAPSREARLARLDALATLMDTAFIIPGSNVRFGLDALIGLVPAIGDAITTAISLYIVHEARQLGAPRHIVFRMLGNVALDGLVGAVPLVGDAFDVIWRANRRNMRLLQEWLVRTERRRSEHTEAWWPRLPRAAEQSANK